MIADLKDKFAGLDRKRIYTAAAALLIAGAAGHFMQRSASLPANAPTQGDGSRQVAAASAATPTPPVNASGQPAPEQVAEAPAPAEPDDSASATALADEILANAAADGTLPDTPSQDGVATDVPELAMASDPLTPEAESPDVTRGEGNAFIDMPDGIDPIDPAPMPDTTVADLPETIAPVDSAPVVPEPAPFQVAALDENAAPVEEPTPPADDPALADCAISLDAKPQPGALVALSVEAPCNAGEEVEFDQDGLLFSEMLGPNGDLEMLVPAVTDIAVIRATFADGQEKAVETDVPDFAAFERMAVVWKGSTGLQLHALENGATYGDPGHVWANHPGSPKMAVEGNGGFVSVLGSTSDGYAADVYTYPVTGMPDGTAPEVSIEAQVMENTCETKIEGFILRTNLGGAPNIQPLEMTVPTCAAVGEYLVLKNLPQDLKLARN